MSLVVCSNQDSDSTTTTTAQSIYKPYSFRNALSSTYTIPKNAQVALQSCKYNLDGSIPLTGGDQVLYQYYGQDLTEGENIEVKSSAVPIRTPLFDGRTGTIEEVMAEELASNLATALNDNIFHPQLRDLVSTDVKRDTTTNEFQGYTINYDYFDTDNSTIPTTAQCIDQMSNEVVNDGAYENFEWDGESFTALDPVRPVPAVGVLAGHPLSAHNGSFQVNFDDPNSVGVEWACGLSRFVNHFVDNYPGSSTQKREPAYWRDASPPFGDTQPNDVFFFDYVVCRRDGLLKVYHTCADSGATNRILPRELTYGDETVPADYDINANASGYTSVKFVLIGQRIEIYMVVEETEDLLYQYDATLANTNQLSCVHQARWNLYPLLYVESDTATFGNSLTVEQFTGCTQVKTLKAHLDDGEPEKVSWYNSVENTADEGRAFELETRIWNDRDSGVSRWDTYMTWAGILGGANEVIDLENYLIMKPDDTFSPSIGANTEKLLGFDGASPTNEFVYGSGTDPHTRRTFESVSVPQLLASRSMFVRLENMTQNSVNARQGNRSSIIAHLPRFDGQVETGRIYHEPKNLIYLDLNNSSEMKVSSFDISFVYSNEQYVRALTGQSVVCLYFREKPKLD